ncbi:hypothetical protein [Crenalkalicoccus roseus]|uniref:hypothetical protein n=1 Tax=Crenalkalicoccus roseus TaxID=1485588 RepID=UPI0013053B31|nr:hypothetical protein [Crenalkalicoccus roseus]
MARGKPGRPPGKHAPARPPPAPLLSQAAFARWLGCHPTRVARWVAEGRLTRRQDGLIEAEAGVNELLASGTILPPSGEDAEAIAPRVAEAIRAAAPNLVSYDEAKAFTEILRAHRAHLDLRERQGELIRADLAEGLLFEAGRAWRDAWMTWPSRVAALMAAELGVAPAAMLAALERQVRAHLETLADPRVDWRAGAREMRRDAA